MYRTLNRNLNIVPGVLSNNMHNSTYLVFSIFWTVSDTLCLLTRGGTYPLLFCALVISCYCIPHLPLHCLFARVLAVVCVQFLLTLSWCENRTLCKGYSFPWDIWFLHHRTRSTLCVWWTFMLPGTCVVGSFPRCVGARILSHLQS